MIRWKGNDVYFQEPFLHSLYLRLIKYSMPSPYQLRQYLACKQTKISIVRTRYYQALFLWIILVLFLVPDFVRCANIPRKGCVFCEKLEKFLLCMIHCKLLNSFICYVTYRIVIQQRRGMIQVKKSKAKKGTIFTYRASKTTKISMYCHFNF